MIQLESLSFKELKQLQKDVEAAIADYQDREKRRALAEVEALVRERGLSPSDLAALIGRKGKKSQGAAKYANPDDPTQTWTGRGRKPGWVISALAQGKPLDSMAI